MGGVGRKMSNNTIQLFEKLAEDTWERIEYGENLNCRQSEETITDINLLDIMRAELKNVVVSKANKGNEKFTGLDWEWWIGSNSTGWWRYAIQAKKISPEGKYAKLRHKVKDEYQINILERYSKANNCIPLYCFYNHIEEEPLDKYWHCVDEYEKKQLGCTVVPLDIVREAFQKGANKSFFALHKDRRCLPWRCLVKCPRFNELYRKGAPNFLASAGYKSVKPYEINLSDIKSNYVINPEFYSKEIDILPKRILIIEIKD
ncbi:hypothetical protein BLX04_15000 [Bacillus mycoides]|nr:hypothetical protein BLX04_15000 [Bacillus mycoides]